MGEDERQSGDPLTLAAAIEQAPYIVLVCEGPQLRMVGANATTRALLTNWGLDRPLREGLADLLGQQWFDIYEQVYTTGEPVAGREWRVHLDGPDGSVHEMFANFTISPWHNLDGSIRGVIGLGSDVTESVMARRTAELRATRAEEREAHSVATIDALQRALLPNALPVPAGAQIAASYLLADGDAGAGGDWFDAVVLDDTKVALVLGDVVGHGIAATAVMGQLRAVLQDRLDDGAGIVGALRAVDRLAGRLPGAMAATVCVAVLNTLTGELTYCTAGHPPPLLLRAGEAGRYLLPTGAGPLGTGSAFPTAYARLEVGDMLLLYSDGIVDRPGRPMATATVELAQVATDIAAGRAFRGPVTSAAEKVCSETVELLVRGTGFADDITLLTVQRVPLTAPLALRLPAEVNSAASCRAVVREWLAGIGVDRRDMSCLLHSVGELVANAIEHAYSDVVGTVSVQASHLGGHVEFSVSDDGRWREHPSNPDRGRGLAIAAELVDEVHVQRTVAGTVGVVRHRLTRPAMLLADSPTAIIVPPVAGPPIDEPMLVLSQPVAAGTVGVHGPVDSMTAPQLAMELGHRSHGGTRPLTVDLTGVTHFASAGVSVLYQALARHAKHGTTLTIDAAPGSVAQHILALTAIGLVQGRPATRPLL
ncbi:SpoIIE family protein phosphatase [Rhizocola hellebori]|nr:SpoIIE family protein phosphatase [Rhizocola hellebori]